MIPEKLRDQWALALDRAEVLFLADNGGGYPDCLSSPALTPAGRRVILCRLGFQVAELYEMADSQGNRRPWAQLNTGTAINLSDGFAVRTVERGRRR